MNCLIILPHEFIAPNQARLIGLRAKHAIESHALRTGIEIFAGELDGKLGQAIVVSASSELIELRTEFVLDPPIRAPVDILIAVPRPQTVKKVLGVATTMGIRSIHFIKSANTVKSYLQSPTLFSENIWREVLKGLEQACDTRAPTVQVHPRLRDVFDGLLPSLIRDNPVRFVLDTTRSTAKDGATWHLLSADQPVIGAVGPESGWNRSELELFWNLGFTSASLGPRMLRVETAVTSFISRIELMRERPGVI